MLRDPDLTPRPWRARRRVRFHPLLLLPLAPLVGVGLVLGRALTQPSPEHWVTMAHLVALTMVASVASPWHLPRRPVDDPVGRTITFRARAGLGLMPLGLVLWGVVALVHFELMRSEVVDREVAVWEVELPWGFMLPLGFLLVALGLYVARPAQQHELVVGVDGLRLHHGRRGFSAQWDQTLQLVPTLVDGRHRRIEVHGPGLVAVNRRGHLVRPTIEADLLDSDAVRLWLTLEYYHRHPAHREELGTRASRWRRAEWRRLLPREAPQPGSRR
ncbi:hypothetical protein OO014_08340 [Intrasporangium calvum]|uniref:PH domain-containing protein n=1 Tax=Intrasporangium calvum TaxID=53358 RepID=A0ABT5GGC8_9MICO|nr:hypothetical protein [Intrasporangium calvum]MDC5697264.1 hypothetical protein [Intrasporangium calvum]